MSNNNYTLEIRIKVLLIFHKRAEILPTVLSSCVWFQAANVDKYIGALVETKKISLQEGYGGQIYKALQCPHAGA